MILTETRRLRQLAHAPNLRTRSALSLGNSSNGRVRPLPPACDRPSSVVVSEARGDLVFAGMVLMYSDSRPGAVVIRPISTASRPIWSYMAWVVGFGTATTWSCPWLEAWGSMVPGGRPLFAGTLPLEPRPI